MLEETLVNEADLWYSFQLQKYAHKDTHTHTLQCFTLKKKAAQSTAAYCCPDHKREPWQLFLSLHHNLKLMRFPPTNSPYLTGKTSSFHGNRMEGENKRETETEGRMDVRGVERGELTETGK